MFDAADICPECGKNQMPPLKAGSLAQAMACQNCGYVQELYPVAEKPTEVPNAGSQS